MVLLFNGDDGFVGVWIKTVPTGREGWVNVIAQPAAQGFFSVITSLFKRPQISIRNVPESSVKGPFVVGPPDEQRQIIFLTQGENGGSRLMDEIGLLQNKTVNILRQQLQDEIIRAQSAEEERKRALQGAKSQQKLIHDITPPKEKRGFPFRDRESWGGETQEE
jgi:hypothetical protein